MAIAFFGGSFNPVHIGHIIVARDVLERCNLDKIYFMPAYISPFKSPPEVSAVQRLQMLKVALKGEPWAHIEELEIKRKGISYTYESALILKAKYHVRPTFIIAYDAYLSLDKWYNYEKLRDIADFIVAKRTIDKIKKNIDISAVFCDTRIIDISSSEIRKRIKEGKSIKYMVPDNVLDYIEKEELYAKS